MARGQINAHMIKAAEKADLTKIESHIATFSANVNYVDPVSHKGVVQLIAETSPALVNSLYRLAEHAFTYATVVVRVAFDVGSGSTKSGLYLVDTQSNTILKLLDSKSVPLGYQASINSKTQALSQETMGEGLSVLQLIAESYQIDPSLVENHGIATAWARNAVNSQEYIDNYLMPNGFEIYSITQVEEGKIGFRAVAANHSVVITDPDSIVVWDIGGGSFQLSTMNAGGDIHVYTGLLGSANFQSVLQDKGFPEGPLSRNQVEQAKPLIQSLIADAIQTGHVILDKIATGNAAIYGIGALMNFGVKPLGGKSTYTRQDIDGFITDFYKGNEGVISIEEFKALFPTMDAAFFDEVQPNLLLLSAIMEDTAIEEIHIVNARATDAIVLSAPIETYMTGVIPDLWAV